MKKIINFIQFRLLSRYKTLSNQINELEWAHIYSDSIRGIPYIENLHLNIGRWAGNYSFFYVLNRILYDYKPQKILEFGLGESTKLISTYVEHHLDNAVHKIFEHDKNWIDYFKSRFVLADKCEIINLDLNDKLINGYHVTSYNKVFNDEFNDYELYLIDGPFGSDRYSRYDIIAYIENFKLFSEFIILFDDTDRRGEMDTIKVIFNLLETKHIKYYTKNYKGNKQSTIICSEKYKFATSF